MSSPRSSALRRGIRALVRGHELPQPAVPRRPKAPSGDGHHGRWIRIVPERQPLAPELDTDPADPTEAAAVRAGWMLVDAHERLSTKGAEKVFGPELAAWYEYAARSVEPLRPAGWSGEYPMQEGRNNLLRYRRTMDFARPGDRVFDVGFGLGQLASLLIRDVGVASYHGIDVVEKFVPMVSELLEVNGLSDASVTVELGDLMALTREQVEATGATFVICCEVLEHVPDAEAALRILADALPDGVDLLFSVPLHGRLEAVWGHLSVFDVARLKSMLDGAGLVAHHVEPLANTWTLVVASRSAEPSQRVRAASSRPPVRVAQPLTRARDFVDVDADAMTPVGDLGGVSFAVDGLEALRLRLGLTDVTHVTRFVVTAFAGGREACRWTWEPQPFQIEQPERRLAMRPGENSGHFVSGRANRLEHADRVEVTAEVAPGQTASFTVAAAYLP